MDCDRCPAHAVVVYRRPDHADIPACQHHSNEWYPILTEQGWTMGFPKTVLGPLTIDPSTH